MLRWNHDAHTAAGRIVLARSAAGVRLRAFPSGLPGFVAEKGASVAKWQTLKAHTLLGESPCGFDSRRWHRRNHLAACDSPRVYSAWV
jgi:hypothetical protein